MIMEERIFDIVKTIEKLRGYDTAIMTTFNFDIEFFEQFLLNKLVNAGIRKIYIFVDNKQWQETLKDSYFSKLGRGYIVKPVSIASAFHPKLSLFLGEDKGKVIVGSGNITVNGYTSNNEIFNEIIFDNHHKDNLKVIIDSIDFIKHINGYAFDNGDDELLKTLNSFKYIDFKVSDNPNIRLLSNTHSSLLEQVNHLIDEQIQEISVFSPFYDNELLAYSTLKHAFNCTTKLYVQNIKGRFPMEYNITKNIINDKELIVFDKITVGDYKSDKFYHGKVFVFKTDDHDYVLYGSANCTAAALLKSLLDNGNIEVCFFEKCGKDDMNDFYQSFRPIEDIQDMNCKPLEYKSVHKELVTYLYGNYNVNGEFHAVMKIDTSLNVVYISINGIEVIYNNINDLYHISYTGDAVFTDNVSLDIEVKTTDNIYQVKGWFIHYPSIMHNFVNANIMSIFSINHEEDLQYSDYYELLENIDFTIDKAEQYKLLMQKISKRNEILDEEEEYVFDIDEQEEWHFVQKAKQKVHHVLMHKLSSILTKYKTYTFDNSKSLNFTSNDNVIIEKEYSALDRLFKNLKRLFSSMINQEYISLVSTREYMNNIIYVKLIMDKLLTDHYLIIDPDAKSQFADLKYMYTHLCEIIMSLISKDDINSISDDEKELIIYISMYVVIFGYILNDYRVDNNVMLKNKVLINKIDKLLNISDKFEQYLFSVLVAIEEYNGNKKLSVNFDSKYAMYKQYIDSLFDNVTVNKMISYLKKVYKDSFVLKNHDTKIEVVIETENIFDRTRIVATAKELQKFYKTSNIPIHLIYERLVQPKDLPTQAIKNEIVINKTSVRLKQIVHRKNGTVDKDKEFNLV